MIQVRKVVRCVVLCAVVMAMDAQPARAGTMSDLRTTIVLSELMVPDLRMEVVPALDRTALVLSFPVVISVARIDRLELTVDTFGEPQLQARDNAWRLLGGMRMSFEGDDEPKPSLFVEGGGLTGQDGDGWFAGIGVAGAAARGLSTSALIYRVVVADGVVRHDLSVDLVRVDLRAAFP